jgi:hypothetical protein
MMTMMMIIIITIMIMKETIGNIIKIIFMLHQALGWPEMTSFPKGRGVKTMMTLHNFPF